MAGMRKFVGISEAFRELAPNAQWAIRDNDYDNVTWYTPEIPRPSREAVEAKIAELEAGEPMRALREVRDWYLGQCDWTQCQDIRAIKGPEWCERWDTYRQELRDMTKTAQPAWSDMNLLTNIDWPQMPPK